MCVAKEPEDCKHRIFWTFQEFHNLKTALTSGLLINTLIYRVSEVDGTVTWQQATRSSNSGQRGLLIMRSHSSSNFHKNNTHLCFIPNDQLVWNLHYSSKCWLAHTFNKVCVFTSTHPEMDQKHNSESTVLAVEYANANIMAKTQL